MTGRTEKEAALKTIQDITADLTLRVGQLLNSSIDLVMMALDTRGAKIVKVTSPEGRPQMKVVKYTLNGRTFHSTLELVFKDKQYFVLLNGERNWQDKMRDILRVA